MLFRAHEYRYIALPEFFAGLGSFEVLYARITIGLFFTFITVTQLQAQWAQTPWIDNADSQDGIRSHLDSNCNPMRISVKDGDGRAIAGAVLVMEDTGYPTSTDLLGIAEITACKVGIMPPRVSIRASGYKSAGLTLLLASSSRFEVTLESEASIPRSTATTVDVAELDSRTREKARFLQKKAVKALEDRKYEDAEKLFREALQLIPASPVIANYLGSIALQNREYDVAESWFQKATSAAPFQPTYLANIGLVRWLQQRPDESYDIMTEACARGYQSNLAHFILGTVGLGKGRNQEAVYHLTKISSKEFPYRDLYLSMAFRNIGRIKEADRLYRKFAQRNPGIGPNGQSSNETALLAIP